MVDKTTTIRNNATGVSLEGPINPSEDSHVHIKNTLSGCLVSLTVSDLKFLYETYLGAYSKNQPEDSLCSSTSKEKINKSSELKINWDFVLSEVREWCGQGSGTHKHENLWIAMDSNGDWYAFTEEEPHFTACGDEGDWDVGFNYEAEAIYLGQHHVVLGGEIPSAADSLIPHPDNTI